MNKNKNSFKWPDCFPEGVPPDDSTPAHGMAFRLVDKIPPDEADFLVTRKEYPERKYTDESSVVKSYGVSFFTAKSAAEKVKHKYIPLANKEIAYGNLIAELGNISKKAKKNHITLWKYIGSFPHLHIKDKA